MRMLSNDLKLRHWHVFQKDETSGNRPAAGILCYATIINHSYENFGSVMAKTRWAGAGRR